MKGTRRAAHGEVDGQPEGKVEKAVHPGFSRGPRVSEQFCYVLGNCKDVLLVLLNSTSRSTICFLETSKSLIEKMVVEKW